MSLSGEVANAACLCIVDCGLSSAPRAIARTPIRIAVSVTSRAFALACDLLRRCTGLSHPPIEIREETRHAFCS